MMTLPGADLTTNSFSLEAVLRANIPDLWNVPPPPRCLTFDDIRWLWAAVHHAGSELRKLCESEQYTPRRELLMMLCVHVQTPVCAWRGPLTPQ